MNIQINLSFTAFAFLFLFLFVGCTSQQKGNENVESLEGTMMVTVDEDGEIVTEIVVKYYYLPKVLVIEKHIDIKTDTDIEPEIVHKGDRGEAYKTENKEYINYDLVEERLPENAEGTMEVTIDANGNVITETVVKYYYLRYR